MFAFLKMSNLGHEAAAVRLVRVQVLTFFSSHHILFILFSKINTVTIIFPPLNEKLNKVKISCDDFRHIC